MLSLAFGMFLKNNHLVQYSLGDYVKGLKLLIFEIIHLYNIVDESILRCVNLRLNTENKGKEKP